jgi:hypothetical protein
MGLSQEAVEFTAGRIEGALFLFRVVVNQFQCRSVNSDFNRIRLRIFCTGTFRSNIDPQLAFWPAVPTHLFRSGPMPRVCPRYERGTADSHPAAITLHLPIATSARSRRDGSRVQGYPFRSLAYPIR